MQFLTELIFILEISYCNFKLWCIFKLRDKNDNLILNFDAYLKLEMERGVVIGKI